MLRQLLSKKKLKNLFKTDFWLEFTTPNAAKKGIKYWDQDETRIGLKTLERKKLQLLSQTNR
jgi:hypothetical protein